MRSARRLKRRFPRKYLVYGNLKGGSIAASASCSAERECYQCAKAAPCKEFHNQGRSV
jgi:hypothetical protein